MVLRKTSATAARAGFTLLEMLAVVAILVVLAGVGGYYYTKSVDDAKKDAARLQVKNLTTAVEAYYIKHGEYPPSLLVLTERDQDGGKPALDPEALHSPWTGREYQYDPTGPNNAGNKPDIWVDGPTGKIGNWTQQRV